MANDLTNVEVIAETLPQQNLERLAAATRISLGGLVPETLVRILFQTIDSGDWDGLQRVFCENAKYERPGYEPLVGYERVKAFYRDERVIASGTHYLEGVVVSGDSGACWGRFVGTHKNGSPIDERFADAYTFQSGKIVTRRSYFFRPAI